MEEKMMNTLLQFVKANKSFSDALMKDMYPDANPYINFELVFIYLNANMELLREYDIEAYEFISEMFNNSNYYIEGNFVYIDNLAYSIDSFINLVHKLEGCKHKAIKIPQQLFVESKNNVREIPKRECKVYSFNDYKRFTAYEMSERDLIFQYTNRVDKATKPYIEQVTYNFKRFISFVVTNYFNGQQKKLNNKELLIISSYINLFPLFSYGKDLVEFPYGMFPIPINEIGVAKITFDNQEVLELNRKYKRVQEKVSQLTFQEKFVRDNGYADSQSLSKIRRKIDALENRAMELLYELYETTHYEHIFNPTFLKNVWQSFKGNTIDINTLFHNPVLKIFAIQKGVTNFYCAMHLDVLTKLIDNDIILEVLDSEQKLLLDN